MAEPAPDAGDVYEAAETVCGFVVTGCQARAVLQLVEAAFDHVAQRIDRHVDRLAQLAVLSHGDHGQRVAALDVFPNFIRDAVTGRAPCTAVSACPIGDWLLPFPYRIHMEDYGMQLFVGLDVSLAKTALCVVSEHGRIVLEAEIASEPEPLTAWLTALDGAISAIGLEAGPLSQWLHRGLTEAGLNAVLMETRQVKGALKAMPNKTDRRDAEGIARLLHLGWFRPVHCKSVSAQEVRAVLSARKAVQQNMIALEMSLRGLLRNFGLKVGAISRGRFEDRIRELAGGNAMLETATFPMLRARAVLRHELALLERQVRHMAQEDPICRRLMTMPGVGAVVALTYRSAVDDPTRFTSSKRVGPWVGLTPSRNQSGERDVSGGITKAGDVNLRRALCQAATVMMNRGRSTWLRTWAARVAKRRGHRRAMVALARRIAVILHRIWVDGTTFQPETAPKMA